MKFFVTGGRPVWAALSPINRAQQLPYQLLKALVGLPPTPFQSPQVFARLIPPGTARPSVWNRMLFISGHWIVIGIEAGGWIEEGLFRRANTRPMVASGFIPSATLSIGRLRPRLPASPNRN